MTLRKKAASGAKWSTLSSAVNVVSNLVQLGVLARLLSAEDFGLMSMIMVVIGFANAYMDMGISNAIIHKQETTSQQLSSLYWLNIGAGLLVFALVLLANPLIIDFYNEPRLTDLLVWASGIFLIVPIGQQFQTLLKKELRFKLLSIITISSVTIGTIVAIVSALMGQGVYSLIWGQLSNAFVRTTAYVGIGFAKWPPSLHFKFNDLKGYIGFGIYQMGEKTLNFLEKNIDYILIGRYLGPEILGAYTIAYQLIIVPLKKISPILTKVAFPIFSKRQDDNKSLRKGYMELCKMLMLVVYPLLIGLAVVAPVAIPVFMGAGWELTITLTQILVLVGLSRTLHSPSGVLYLAKGRADIGFKFNLGVALINGVLYWVAVQQGVIILSFVAAGMNFIYFIVLQLIVKSLIGLTWKHYYQKLKNQLMMTLVMAVTVYILYSFLDPVMGEKILLSILICSGGIVYIAGILLYEKEFVKELQAILTNKITAS